jgi:hypothetical protein
LLEVSATGCGTPVSSASAPASDATSTAGFVHRTIALDFIAQFWKEVR